jgi:hypothetical protein
MRAEEKGLAEEGALLNLLKGARRYNLVGEGWGGVSEGKMSGTCSSFSKLRGSNDVQNANRA